MSLYWYLRRLLDWMEGI